MDMDYFVDLGGEVSEESVDLGAAPQSAEEYLRQVQLDRKRQPDVVVAAVPASVFPQTHNTHFHAQPPSDQPASALPPLHWQTRQAQDFVALRENLVLVREKLRRDKALPKLSFPNPENEKGWRSFCLSKWTPQVGRAELLGWAGNRGLEELEALVGEHRGTPPLLRLVLAMSQAEATDLLGFAAEWLGEEGPGDGLDGPSTALLHWLFAVLAVLEEPLEPEALAALRDVARTAKRLRARLAQPSVPDEPADQPADQPSDQRHRELSFFVAVAALVFRQTDLQDLP